jgi:hypothetical protein
VNLLYPRIRKQTLPLMLGLAAYGAVVAGVYGIVHDQVTYTLSPEYFTKFKFQQFAYADFGQGPRVLAGTIGFLATWWVGLIGGWVLGRCAVSGDGPGLGFSDISRRFYFIFLVAMAFGMLGFVYGLWRTSAGAPEAWVRWQESNGVEDLVSFARVGYIHNFGYLGALLGLIASAMGVGRDKKRARLTKA